MGDGGERVVLDGFGWEEWMLQEVDWSQEGGGLARVT